MSAPGRFEYRSVDSAVNPYLSLAALSVAGLAGLALSTKLPASTQEGP